MRSEAKLKSKQEVTHEVCRLRRKRSDPPSHRQDHQGRWDTTDVCHDCARDAAAEICLILPDREK